MTDIILYSHPSFNHDDVPAGSFDWSDTMDNGIAPGTKINVEDTVCNMLIAPNGYAYFAEDYGHVHCAIALGMSGVEDAMGQGYVHVAVTYPDISFYGRLTASQKRTLEEAFFTAKMNASLPRMNTFIKAYTRIAAFEGMATE